MSVAMKSMDSGAGLSGLLFFLLKILVPLVAM
jgi:hypothetical protein